jgi:hypothetical protein
MNLELHLRLAGALQIALAVLHLFFQKRFNWKEELARLSILNRQIFLVHTFFLCFVLASIGALSLLAPEALLQPSPLARMVLAGFSGFWGLRFLFQWFVFDPKLWRGNNFNTVVHGLFTVLWIYLTAVYTGALFLEK